MIIYLAGAMRRQPRYNLDAATAATQNMRSGGHHVISPWEHDAEMGFNFDLPLEEQPDFDMRAALAWDLAQIINLPAPIPRNAAVVVVLPGWEHSAGFRTEAAVVVVLPGWEQSAGFRTEATVARALGLRILQYRDVGMWTCNDKVDQWLKQGGKGNIEVAYRQGHTAGWLECRAQNKANLEAWVNAQ